MPLPPSSRLTAADVAAARLRLLALAADLARTEERIAETFEQLARTLGDPDGHRGRVADEARRVALLQRERSRGPVSL